MSRYKYGFRDSTSKLSADARRCIKCKTRYTMNASGVCTKCLNLEHKTK